MEITKFKPALLPVTDDMTWEQRDAAHDQNIRFLADINQESILRIAAELYKNKFTGAYKESSVWGNDPVDRSWAEYLKRRDYRLTDGDSSLKIDKTKGESLMAWGACVATIQAANGDRVKRNLPLLPLPSNSSQLDPFHGVLARVDDWQPESWPEGWERTELQGPHADEQPEFLRKWEAVYNQLPPEKRTDRKGLPQPPFRNDSRSYLAKERQMLTPDTQPPTLNVGAKAQTAERMAEAAASIPKPKPQKPPELSQREREEQQRQFELEADARKYRMQLLSLQQAAESLEAFLKTSLVRRGADYLDAMRDLDLGAYSVTNDVELLRTAVVVLQSCFRLATEEYVPPVAVEVDPTAATVNV